MPTDSRNVQIRTLQRKLERSQAELDKARTVIEVQGKLSALPGNVLGTDSADQRPGK